MATVVSELQPIGVLAGVQSSIDKSPALTQHFTFADKIRFRFGVPQKLGGWSSLPFTTFNQIGGWARSIYSATIAGVVKTLVGTHSDLYSISGQLLTNVTPLKTTTNAIANSLATDYGTLGNDPFSVISELWTVRFGRQFLRYQHLKESDVVSSGSGWACRIGFGAGYYYF